MYSLNVFTLGNQRKNKKEYIKIGALKHCIIKIRLITKGSIQYA